MLNTLAMLLATATVAPSNTVCGTAQHVRLLNIPIGTTQHSTEIVHAAAITDGSKLLGYLYLVRNGQVWYQNGLLGTGRSLHITLAAPTDAQRALRIVSASPIGRPAPTLYRTGNSNIERALWSAGYSISDCY